MNSNFISLEQLTSVENSTLSPPYFVPTTPTTFTLEITSHCNEKCRGCGNNDLFERTDHYLDTPGWIRILEKIKSHAHFIRITGGECTLHEGFEPIITYLDTLNIPFAIFTNGAWRDRSKILHLLQQCKNLSSLLISLHGKDSISHNAFTNTHFFETTTETIRQVARTNLKVDTNTVFTCYNYQDIEEIVILSQKLGARSAVFSRYYGQGFPIANLTEVELNKAIQTIEALKKRGQAVTLNPCIPACFTPSSSGGCGAGITLCTIDPKGNVRPCNHAPLWFGNLIQTSIEQIWRSSQAQQWHNLIPEGCTNCVAFDDCRGGCRATALHQGLSKDPLIKKPLDTPLDSKPITLYAGLKPKMLSIVREEKEGCLLIRESRVRHIERKIYPLIHTCDGETTLATIRDDFGENGLDVVINLALDGFLEFV